MTTSHLAALAAAAFLAPALAGGAPASLKLAFPLACQIGRTCEVQNYMDRDPGPGVRDYRCKARTYQGHSGVDIRLLDMAAQRAGVNVLAAAPGRVSRLRDGVADISIRAPGAPPVKGQECGNGVVIDHGDGWETQYCHLAQGSVRVKVGDQVAAGQPLARVGLSGATEFPHLHLSVRHDGQAIDPFAPDMSHPAACARQAALWDPAAQRQLAYKSGAVLISGFAGTPVTPAQVAAGGIAPPTSTADYIVPYVSLIGLEAGDRIALNLVGPDGKTLVEVIGAPLDHDKAEFTRIIGKKRPPTGWPHGVYRAKVSVIRAGAVAVTRDFQVTL